MHTAHLRAHGGSVAVTLPIALLRQLGLTAGDAVHVQAHDNGLMLTPAARRKYSLNDLLAMQGDAPLWVDQDWDAMPAAGLEQPL